MVLTASAAAAVVLAACGGGGSSAKSTTTTRATSASSTTTTTAATTSTSRATQTDFPCNLVPLADAAQIAGNPLDPGDGITNHVTEDTTSWTAHECDWSKTGAGTGTEMRFAVSRSADFPSNAVTCPLVPGATSSIPSLGDQASWAWTDTGTQTTVGRLRVCTTSVLVDVTVDGPGTGDAHLAVARALAQKVLAAL